MGVLAILAGIIAGCGEPVSDGGHDAAADGGVDVAADIVVDAPLAPARATFLDTPLDFGLQECGGPPAQSLALLVFNSGGAPLTWSATLDVTPLFSLSGATSGTIAGGDYVAIAIATTSIPTSVHAGEVLQAALTVTTSDPTKATTVVPVRMTAQGATLDILPSIADFGQIPLGTQAPDIPITISNSGNAPVQIMLGAPQSPDFAATWTGAPAAGSVAPDTALAGATIHFNPTSTNVVTDTAKITILGPVCGVPPAPISIKGEGTNGVAGVSPGTLDFGLVNCGATGAAQSVTLLNAGNGAFTFTAALGQGAPYVVSPASGAVPPNSQVQLSVTPNAVPQISAVTPDLYDGTLTITTTAQGDTPHLVALKETARGAILSATGPVAFGRNRVGTTPPAQTLTMTNSGNAPATVVIKATGSYSVSGPATLQASSTAFALVGYTPDPAQLGTLDSTTLAFSTSDVLCAPLPTPTATGTSYERATTIEAGSSRTCAIAASGLTYCWGEASYGALGDGQSSVHRNHPTPVRNLSNAIALGLGDNHTCAIIQGGSVKCWGNNDAGQLGDGTHQSQSTPVDAVGLSNVVSLGAGSRTSYAVRADGTVTSCGFDWIGLFVNGTSSDSSLHVVVAGITDAKLVGAQIYAACALRSSGAVSCWGDNAAGNLGNGTTTSSLTPVDVANLTDAVALTGGPSSYHSCVVRAGGTVSCWGINNYGQLGNGTTTNSSVPVAVPGITDATAIVGGSYRSCALRAGGTVMCWGTNFSYALGDGTNGTALVPVNAHGVTSAASITSGLVHACVLNTNGTLLCWGANGFGALGDGTWTDRATAVAVSGFD